MSNNVNIRAAHDAAMQFAQADQQVWKAYNDHKKELGSEVAQKAWADATAFTDKYFFGDGKPPASVDNSLKFLNSAELQQITALETEAGLSHANLVKYAQQSLETRAVKDSVVPKLKESLGLDDQMATRMRDRIQKAVDAKEGEGLDLDAVVKRAFGVSSKVAVQGEEQSARMGMVNVSKTAQGASIHVGDNEISITNAKDDAVKIGGVTIHDAALKKQINAAVGNVTRPDKDGVARFSVQEANDITLVAGRAERIAKAHEGRQ